MKYTQIPTDTFEKLQFNAGVLCTGFTPSSGDITGLIGATTGGINFTDVPSYSDMGEDIDNCPKNTKELKRIESREVKMAGTFVSLDSASAKMIIGATTSESTKIVPSDDLKSTDFSDIWWVGDYGEDDGFMAVHMMNALSTAGFSIQTTDKNKGTFAFEFTGHYSISAQDTVPYELYIKE